MKIEEFKKELRASLNTICLENKWTFDNPKQRGMAFENWCFNLLRDRYPAADNDPSQCIIRGDDAGISGQQSGGKRFDVGAEVGRSRASDNRAVEFRDSGKKSPSQRFVERLIWAS
jgi:hypothetical protein